MGSKQQLAPRPTSTERGRGGFDGKAPSVRERSGLANASFRVYYSLRAGAVPFLWESAPGTPKGGATTTAVSPASPTKAVEQESGAALLPAISPPPSYHSLELKGRRGCRSRSSWPAEGIVRPLLGMLGFGRRKGHRLPRRHPASYL